MFNSSLLYEKRPLKKPRLGPPDIYPQEPKQKEDELTSINVKHGFPTSTHLSDEFGTARNCNVTASKVGSYFNGIIAKKEELSMLPDSGRKRQQINPKDNFWPVTNRTKTHIEAWFKDLSGNKPLMNLSKRAPNFNKKEEIFMMLTEHQVPMLRAAWFIKLSSAYTVAVSEAKIKKRQMPDPTTEWTGTTLKFLKDQIPKLQEFYSQADKPPPPNATLNSIHTNEIEQKLAMRHWLYCTRLLKYMYEEGLMDRQEVLTWVLELLEKQKAQQSSDDSILRLFLPLTLQYLEEFVQSELLSRRLAHFSTKKLSTMLSNVAETNLMTSPPSESKTEQKDVDKEKKENIAPNPIQSTLMEYQHCNYHRDIILQLSNIVQTISLECPTALVWCGAGVGTIWHGSPLDNLPLAPSMLPLPPRCDTNTYRKRIQYAEYCIRERSKRAEGRWCTEKWQASSAGTVTTRVLAALDALDRHRFDKMDATNSLDTLYAKVFSGGADQESAAVRLLCEWAVSPERTGEHRALAVAALLDRRQSDAGTGGGEQETAPGDDKDSSCSAPGGPPMFQSLLMRFLDADAPVPAPDDCSMKKTAFSNLVHLFAELIRRDVFSHDAYMCTLISRGDLLGPEEMNDPMSNHHHTKMEAMDYDDANIDHDLDKILQNIKEDQQNSMDVPDSPKEHDHHGHHAHAPASMGHHVPMEADHGDHKVRPSRHLLYTTHFPLSQDDPFAQHDCNQRHVLLYGVGKIRDEARHTVKKMSKEICKLFSKKFSIDVAEGGKVKKHSRNEFNFEATTQKCQSLSYFDQHLVTWQCSVTVVEILNSFATGNSNYLPVQEHVAFLFDLMELSLNIHGLIDVCTQILRELPEVENQLCNKNLMLSRNYTTSLSLYVVGVLRRYHCCLLLSPEQTSAVFEGLCKVVKHVSNPGDCSSAERCILAHLYDLYSSCSLLKSKPHAVEPFGNAYPKIKQALYTSPQPTPSNVYIYNPQCMQELFLSPRRAGRIDSVLAKQLNENGNNRYSFVSNAIIHVCRETDNERLNDLAILCAEMTACCNSLASEWLGVLLTLCCPLSHPGYYAEILNQLDIQDVGIHNALAVFTCILIARHCFSLEDFVRRVALPSLLKNGFQVKSLDNGEGRAEGGMRLTCHLLLRLFRTAEGPQPGLYSVGSPPLTAPRPPLGVRLSCDRHLLAAAHRNIHVGPVLAVLKAVLIVGDATAKEGTELSLSNILGTSDLHSGSDGPSLDLPMNVDICGSRTTHRQSSTGNAESTASLSAFACHVLREICSQQWVLERCLSSDELCHVDNLLDPLLSHSQAQRLLHMICYPEVGSSIDSLDQKSMITRILENLEQWTLRMSILDLQLMYEQFSPNSSELSQWLDTVAKAAIDVFQINAPYDSPPMEEKKNDKKQHNSIWLVAPLISKLPPAVQGRVLKVAGQVLEGGGWCKEQKTRSRGCGESQSILSHQPFLTLVLTCLKGQEEGQREGLLSSLNQQLSQLVQQAKEGGLQDTVGTRRMLDGLRLRFALVGGVFDAFQRNPSATTDWALLLVQLVTHGLVDLHTHSDLFTVVVDMLATLVHAAKATDSQDDSRKMYPNLLKKLKKEVGEKQSASLQHIRQLLPLPRVVTEVIAVESAGSSRGNKMSFDSVDKKHDLQVADKQRVSNWDILEGMKNPAPLSWAWFGAVRLERKPLACEDTHRLLKFHTHNLQRPSSHYLDPPPLPPEDLEPIPEKPADTPTSVEQSPAGGSSGGSAGKGRGKGQRKPRKPKAGPGGPMHAAGPMALGQPPQGQSAPPGAGGQGGGGAPLGGQHLGGYGQAAGGPPQGQQYAPGQQGWYGQGPQQGYYPPMPGNRFERPPQLNNQSKQALSNMLRSRQPLNSFIPGMQNNPNAQPMGNYSPMQRGFPRQAIRQPHPSSIQSSQGFIPQQYSNMQSGMGQQYAGNYGGNPQTMMQGNIQGNQQMLQGAQSNMFAGQQQGFGQPRPSQPDYRQMGQNPRAPYMQQAPNVTMNTNMGSMGGMAGQGGPAPPYSRTAGQSLQPGMQNQNQFQQQQQQQQRMRMLALQQQQQQQQSGPQGGQPSQALVAHLQRQQMNPNQYHQPPPYNMQ